MTFVRDIEEAVEELADWTVETVNEIIGEIMADGKPFFLEPKTELEELEEYAGVRGNPEAWTKWIAEQTGAIIMELQDSAVAPDLIISVHPVDIAQKVAIDWSARMEDLLLKPEYQLLDFGPPLPAIAPAISQPPAPPTPITPPSSNGSTAAASMLTGII